LHNTAVSHALEYASGLLGEGAWCEGESITLADLALVSALTYLDLRQSERDWRGTHANLAAWFARISARPSVIASNTRSVREMLIYSSSPQKRGSSAFISLGSRLMKQLSID